MHQWWTSVTVVVSLIFAVNGVVRIGMVSYGKKDSTVLGECQEYLYEKRDMVVNRGKR